MKTRCRSYPALARTSSSILNKYGKNGKPCLVLDLSGIALSFSPFNLTMAVGLLEAGFLAAEGQGTGEMSHQLKAFAAFPEDPGSVPSTHKSRPCQLIAECVGNMFQKKPPKYDGPNGEEKNHSTIVRRLCLQLYAAYR
ncbi:hypothetical protein STEG23_000675 [Scotinomys teguina]